ncbi:MAG TPA: four helix bundle protein [Methylotenera sp.]|nr:four helix bundle protein [Methylotenera sp.]
MNVIKSYRDLQVWRLAINLSTEVYATTSSFPKNEIFGLCSQLQRAAVSVASNIAEGHARESTKEYLRFISIALGSLAELETQFIISNNLNYINQVNLDGILEKTSEIGRMLRGLQKSLKAKLLDPTSP